MGRIEKQKRLIIENANKRLLGEQEEIELGTLVNSGLAIYNKAVEKWGKDNFKIIKDKVNKEWVAINLKDENDKITEKFSQEDEI